MQINGRMFLKNQIVEKGIVIEDGIIKKIANIAQSEQEKQDQVINANNMLILPGLVDVHVHMREPGDTYKEDFLTGSKAAIAGGITTVIDMPNNKVPTVTAARLEEKKKLAKRAICDIFFHMGTTEDNFNEIKKADPISLKIYASETTGNMKINDENIIKKHFENFDKNKPIVIHAEGQQLIEKIAALAKKTKRKIHLAHATTAKEIETIKAIGASVEVTPHHLFLSKKHEEKLGKLAPVKPPLRDETSRKSLWQNLDKIDCIATDHAPHSLEDKENGAYGYPGLETSLALMLDAYNKRLLTLSWIVERMATNPAKIFGLNCGEIATGKKADLIIVDVKGEWRVNGEELETKCKWSPFDGQMLKGRVKTVIRNGKVVYENEEFY